MSEDENTFSMDKLLAMVRRLDQIPDDVIAYHPLVGAQSLQMVDDKGTITVIGPSALHALRQNVKEQPHSQNSILAGSLGGVFGSIPVVFLEDGGALAEKTHKRIAASLKAAGQVMDIFENLRNPPPNPHTNPNIL